MSKKEKLSQVETIFALSTVYGKSGVAIVRLSGPRSEAIVRDLTQNAKIPVREAVHTALYDIETNLPIDEAIVLLFKAPRSFTGEDAAELQVHGSIAVIKALLKTLSDRNDCRLAEAGEFSKRAFDNGRLDLTQAEGLADLIEAETDLQRKSALNQLGGNLRGLYQGWRDTLIKALAYLEADIDFVDEEDVSDTVLNVSRETLAGLTNDIQAHLADNRVGERLRHGVTVAIVGPPNAGKSTLINTLAQRDAAIVSDIPGTTRDVIDISLDLSGYPVVLTDTAGLRDSADPIEVEGIRRARSKADAADILVYMTEDDNVSRETIETEMGRFPDLLVKNKADLAKSEAADLQISLKTGQGVEEFVSKLTELVAARAGQGEAPTITRERYRLGLQDSVVALKRAEAAALPELMAEDMRMAARHIGRLTGHVDVEDLLDVIFADFCIGK